MLFGTMFRGLAHSLFDLVQMPCFSMYSNSCFAMANFSWFSRRAREYTGCPFVIIWCWTGVFNGLALLYEVGVVKTLNSFSNSWYTLFLFIEKLVRNLQIHVHRVLAI